jgi:chromosome segregation ATPase
MSENIILEHLRAIRGDLAGINERLDGVDYRLNAIEHAIAGMAKNIANLYELYATYSTRIDATGKRVTRIERRLELRDETP